MYVPYMTLYVYTSYMYLRIYTCMCIMYMYSTDQMQGIYKANMFAFSCKLVCFLV